VSGALNRIRRVIYCVVPQALADQLLEPLTNYYFEDPNVTVIVDRRKASRRQRNSASEGKRVLRDRRRLRVAGDLLELTKV
jgi:hypothetical protein